MVTITIGWTVQWSTYFCLCGVMTVQTLTFCTDSIVIPRFFWSPKPWTCGPGLRPAWHPKPLVLCNGRSEHACPWSSSSSRSSKATLTLSFVILCDTLQTVLLLCGLPVALFTWAAPEGGCKAEDREGLDAVCSSLPLQGESCSPCELFLLAWGFCKHHPSRTSSRSIWGAFL